VEGGGRRAVVGPGWHRREFRGGRAWPALFLPLLLPLWASLSPRGTELLFLAVSVATWASRVGSGVRELGLARAWLPWALPAALAAARKK
jgi:hypothetical protein